MNDPKSILVIQKSADLKPVSIRFTSFVEDSHTEQREQIMKDLQILDNFTNEQKRINQMSKQIKEMNDQIKLYLESN